MPSTRERVIQAVVALLRAALPQAAHGRNEAKPRTIPNGGTVTVDDGVPGTPEVTLSPATYIFEHEIPVEVVARKSPGETAEARLDAMLQAIGAAIAADRTLGGLCDHLEVTAPDTEPLTGEGAAVSRSAVLGLVAVYGTSDPLN